MNSRKLTLLKKYIEKEPFTKEDLEWMDANDWHPVDERQMGIKFIEKIENAEKVKSLKVKNVGELF